MEVQEVMEIQKEEAAMNYWRWIELVDGRSEALYDKLENAGGVDLVIM